MAKSKVKRKKNPINWSKELDGMDYLIYSLVIIVAVIVFFAVGGHFDQLIQAMKSL